MTDPRDQFEPQYALAHAIDPLQVKFERAATGSYRDLTIKQAFCAYLEAQAQRWTA
jgi:hypothetical protein